LKFKKAKNHTISCGSLHSLKKLQFSFLEFQSQFLEFQFQYTKYHKKIELFKFHF